MALPEFRQIDVTDAVDGRIGTISKRVAEKHIHTIYCNGWIGSRGSLSGTPTAALSPSDANAPTVTVGAPTNNHFDVTVDAGSASWGTGGKGSIALTLTYSNGEKDILTLDYQILA